MKLISTLLLTIVGLTSCSSNDSVFDNILVKAHIAEPNKVRFSGKGAGAGMMLMSSMGPMGIAIGVAIDEGIANDIDKTAKIYGFDIEALVLKKLSSVLKSKATIFETQPDNEITVDILRYGFVIQPGGDDLVAAQLHLNISFNGQAWLTIKYPEQLTEHQLVGIKTATLESVKDNGQKVEDLFNYSLLQAAILINTTSEDVNKAAG